jgi:SAM-dependent methyltransferase
MNITQTFYDNLAAQYDKLFQDWEATTHEQALILNKIFVDSGFDRTARILDCACGIGPQAIGLAAIGYSVTASDISDGELAEATARAEKNGVSNIRAIAADLLTWLDHNVEYSRLNVFCAVFLWFGVLLRALSQEKKLKSSGFGSFFCFSVLFGYFINFPQRWHLPLQRAVVCHRPNPSLSRFLLFSITPQPAGSFHIIAIQS